MKRMNKYFVYEGENKGIFVMLIVFLVCDIFALVANIIGWDAAWELIAGVFSVPLLSGIAMLYRCFKTKESTENNDAPKDLKVFKLFTEDDFKTSDISEGKSNNKKEETIIPRQKHCDRLTKLIKSMHKQTNYKSKTLNCIFLTGESGSGKSTLLHKKLVRDGINGEKLYYLRSEENYSEFSREKTSIDASVIILDQFESRIPTESNSETIPRDDVVKKIRNVVRGDKKSVFIFSFPQADLPRVYDYLLSEFPEMNVKVYFLKANDDDKVDLVDKIKVYATQYLRDNGADNSNRVRECLSAIEAYPPNDDRLKQFKEDLRILCLSLVHVRENRVPLVSLFAIGSILEAAQLKDKTSFPIDDFENPENIIRQYLDGWVNKFINKENAKAVLYLLTDMYHYSYDDIKHITFETSSDSDPIKVYFMEIENSVFTAPKTGAETRYGVIHEYLAKRIDDFLSDVETDVKENIKYIRSRVIKVRSEELSSTLNKRYDKYKAAQLRMKKILIVLLVLSSIFHVARYVYDYQTHASVWIDAWRIGLSCALFLAIYYYYNYCKHVLCLFEGHVYIVPVIIGILSVWLSQIFTDLWGVFVGTAYLFHGIYHIYISRRLEPRAKDDFKKLFISLMVATPYVYTLGVYYKLSYSSSLTANQSFPIVIIIMFIGFIIYCNSKHINQRCMLLKKSFVNMKIPLYKKEGDDK